MFQAIRKYAGDLLRSFWQYDDQWHLAISTEPVALIGAHGIYIGNDAFAGNDGTQIRNNFLPPADDLGIWLRHAHE
jgi:hypothetical protein